MSKNILLLGAILIILGIFFLFSGKDNGSQGNEAATESKKQLTFESISSSELENMLKNKDFTLIDVHTPEQRHIPGTDYVISFDQIEKIESALKDKNQKVVLYCRSGSMSKIAADDLIEKGYTNVFELENGLNEWLAEDRETLPKAGMEIIN